MDKAQRPRLEWNEDRPLIEGKTVFESEPERTGLLNADGRPIVKVKAPIGFVPPKGSR